LTSDDANATGGYDLGKTEIVDSPTPTKVVKISSEKKAIIKEQSKADTDNFFDEFRDR
jgi:hypothetical protein